MRSASSASGEQREKIPDQQLQQQDDITVVVEVQVVTKYR